MIGNVVGKAQELSAVYDIKQHRQICIATVGQASWHIHAFRLKAYQRADECYDSLARFSVHCGVSDTEKASRLGRGLSRSHNGRASLN